MQKLTIGLTLHSLVLASCSFGANVKATPKEDIRPHFILGEKLQNGLMTLDKLGVKGNAKTVHDGFSVFDYEEGPQEDGYDEWSFDRDGRIVSYKELPGDACGGDEYTIEYDANGRISTVNCNFVEYNQDDTGNKISATYTFTYDGNRIAEITEKTSSVSGKSISLPNVHYKVTYDKTATSSEDPAICDYNGISEVRCIEDPDFFVKYTKDGKISSYRMYALESDYVDGEFIGRWKISSKESGKTATLNGQYYFQKDDNQPTITGYFIGKSIQDSHGNHRRLLKKTVYGGGEDSYESEIFRKIEYWE